MFGRFKSNTDSARMDNQKQSCPTCDLLLRLLEEERLENRILLEKLLTNLGAKEPNQVHVSEISSIAPIKVQTRRFSDFRNTFNQNPREQERIQRMKAEAEEAHRRMVIEQGLATQKEMDPQNDGILNEGIG